MIRRGALVLALAMAGGCSPTPSVAPGTGVVLDGFVLGAPRTVSGAEFHRLETTARDVAASAWPATPATSFALYSAGTLPDGTVQPGTDGPMTFLLAVGLAGGDRHAMVIQCQEATFPDPGSCAPAQRGS